jgi:mRNA interferase RelE/StbE
MSWLITVGPGAERDIRKLDARAQSQVVAALDKLSADPWTAGAEKLSHRQKFWRVRSGNYRIMCTIEERQRRLLVLLIRHRRDAYRDLDILERRLLTAMTRRAE